MTRIPYITPAVRQLPLQFDAVFCVSNTTTVNDPYEDNGDYEWS